MGKVRRPGGIPRVARQGGTAVARVVVIQEIMGVNEHIEDVTRRIAAAGYVALAPDLFSVNGERPRLYPGADQQAMAFCAAAASAGNGRPGA